MSRASYRCAAGHRTWTAGTSDSAPAPRLIIKSCGKVLKTGGRCARLAYYVPGEAEVRRAERELREFGLHDPSLARAADVLFDLWRAATERAASQEHLSSLLAVAERSRRSGDWLVLSDDAEATWNAVIALAEDWRNS